MSVLTFQHFCPFSLENIKEESLYEIGSLYEYQL